MRDLGKLGEDARLIELVSPLPVPGLSRSPSCARLIVEDSLMGVIGAHLDRLVKLRRERYEKLRKTSGPKVVAVFPEAAVALVPESVRREQAARLVGSIDAGRVRVHLVAAGSLLLGVTPMLLVFHTHDGEVAVSSDHVDGNVIYEDPSGRTRFQGLVKQALGAALPADQSRSVLENSVG
ncbi:MAG: hypothetical protein JK586_17515 [Nocardiopsis sp. BM-2018]|nr:MAG: hypothetical protein JK586_17515 [Nocardiopsis sp. BM-2018]